MPGVFLLLILVLALLARRKSAFKGLRDIIPYLFILLSLSLIISVLKLDMVADLFDASTIISVLWLAITFIVMIASVRLVAFLFFDLLLSRKSIKYPRLIRDIVVIILYIIGILLILHYVLDIKVTVVLASSAILTVVIGFALQDILGDLFSGIALNFEESLQIGDWVKFDDFEGRVEQFRWRSIKIRTIDNVLVLIPNQVASKQAGLRFGHEGETFAQRLQIGVSYKSNPDTVIDVLCGVLAEVNTILKAPVPQVLVDRFDDFAVVYEIRYWMDDYANKNATESEIHRRAWYAFKRNKIEIPFPIRDVYIKKAVVKTVTDDDILDTLKRNDLLSTISQKQLKHLVDVITVEIHGRGEMIINEGEDGRFFYIILSGQVEVLKNGKVVSSLEKDEYFGEFSLFTGEKTTASVRVSRECQLLRLSSEEFKETVKINENMARKLSEVIARRKSQLMKFKEKEQPLETTKIKKESESIFLRIKKYFSV